MINPGPDQTGYQAQGLGLVMVGAKQPMPMPQPQPAPQPTPQPQPAPTPAPMPQPQPAPAAQPYQQPQQQAPYQQQTPYQPQQAPYPQQQTYPQSPYQQPQQQAPMPQPQPAPAPQPQPAPQQPAEPIELKDEVIVGKDSAITCPYCGNQFTIKAQSEGKGKIKCNRCNRPIIITAKSKTVIMGGPLHPVCTRRGRLVKVNRFWRNEVFKLRDGQNIIGRYDPQSQSDIAIQGDMMMSRRSVEIEVKPAYGGFTFKFTVLKSANPVYFNKKQVGKSYSREIKFGDEFQLGSTTFRFEEDK